MRNSSKKAGCMRRSPASHCCQTRHVECTSAAAAVCVSPAASRAARMRSGSGVAAGEPMRLRFGWATTVLLTKRPRGCATITIPPPRHGGQCGLGRAQRAAQKSTPLTNLLTERAGLAVGVGENVTAISAACKFDCPQIAGPDRENSHFILQAPAARGAAGLDVPDRGNDYTRIARILQLPFVGGA